MLRLAIRTGVTLAAFAAAPVAYVLKSSGNLTVTDEDHHRKGLVPGPAARPVIPIRHTGIAVVLSTILLLATLIGGSVLICKMRNRPRCMLPR